MLDNYVKSITYEPIGMVTECFDYMRDHLTGLGPLKIKSDNLLLEINDKLAQIIKLGGEVLESTANVSVRYSQNSLIEATGSVYIAGPGAYHTNVYAGGEVVITGTCRGGEVRAGGGISVARLGSSTAVITKVETGENFTITAAQVFPNVTFQIGGQTFKADSLMTDVKCYYDCNMGLVVRNSGNPC